MDRAKAEDFITRLRDLMAECGVNNLKMSDHGIKKENFEEYAHLAYKAMKNLFSNDRIELGIEGVVRILENSYR